MDIHYKFWMDESKPLTMRSIYADGWGGGRVLFEDGRDKRVTELSEFFFAKSTLILRDP